MEELLMEKFTIAIEDDFAELGIYDEDLTYDEAKKAIKELTFNLGTELKDIRVYKQYNLKYFGFEEAKKEVKIDYTQGVIVIDGVEHELSEWKKIKDDPSYTVTEIIGHPTPEGECLDEYLV